MKSKKKSAAGADQVRLCRGTPKIYLRLFMEPVFNLQVVSRQIFVRVGFRNQDTQSCRFLASATVYETAAIIPSNVIDMPRFCVRAYGY
uniref:Uncharacterized protein n=1 Tax=Syphacia muris TaxID=451379 RepID=A0A0N5ACK2_9BILA